MPSMSERTSDLVRARGQLASSSLAWTALACCLHSVPGCCLTCHIDSPPWSATFCETTLKARAADSLAREVLNPLGEIHLPPPRLLPADARAMRLYQVHYQEFIRKVRVGRDCATGLRGADRPIV